MRTTLKLAVAAAALAGALGAAAHAQDAPRLVADKKVMTLDAGVEYRENAGIWCMRLSPDGRRLIYLRKKTYKTARPDGEQRERTGYKLVLRDLKTGNDTPVPVAALFDDDYAVAWLSMTIFDPAGKTLVVPAGEDGNGNGLMEPTPPASEPSRPGLYDVASGKVKMLDIKSDLVFPTFSPDGKRLVVLAIEMRGKTAKIHVTPTDKIKFRPLAKAGLIRSLSPTSDLMAIVLLAEGDRPRPDKFVVYDLKADAVKAELASPEESGGMDDRNPQWTADGRYLYYVVTKTEGQGGQERRQRLTRIWDAKTGKEAGILPDVMPVGPGPGSTMVLAKLGAGQGEIVLHAWGDKALAGTLHPLGGAATRPVCTQGKRLLFIRKAADGSETLHLAEIALPKN